MKKYQIIFTVLFVLIFVLWFYLDSLSLKKERPVYLQDLNVSMMGFEGLLGIDKDKIHQSTYMLWGMKISKALTERELQRQALAALNATEKEENNDETKKYENVNVTHKTICIEETCWLFVGKVEVGDITSITLLSKEQKPKLESYKMGDYLSKKTKIIDIRENSMSVLNEDTMDSFNLKLFDINISKYKPKVKKEQNE